MRAKDLFYRFTGRDPLSLYELDKVVFFVNDKLERSFAREYMEMIEKYSRISVPDSPKLSGSEEEVRWPTNTKMQRERHTPTHIHTQSLTNENTRHRHLHYFAPDAAPGVGDVALPQLLSAHPLER